jgi:beta-lactamase class A
LTPSSFSRREFIKLASLSLLSLAAAPVRLPLATRRAGALIEEVLSAEQRQQLQAAARNYLAATNAAADQMAVSIDFIEGRNEAASTMCGPLSVGILQTAGLLGPWARRHDFWLLNPRQNLKPIEYTFPESKYRWYQFDTPIAEFDFSQFPLLSGDLVYLHAKPGDTFEHVLVVNRLDELGRPYSITNYFTHDGTVIEERLLDDPADPAAGQFAAWANRDIRNTLGNTGGGGFRIWRAKSGRSLEYPSGKANEALRATLDELFTQAAGTWFATVKKVNGPYLYQFNPYEPFHPASTIKVPIAMAFYHWLEAEGTPDWLTYVEEHGVFGRSYAQLLRAMIVESEEEATELLVAHLGADYLHTTWQNWGLKYTRVDPRRSSATELISAFESLYAGRWLAADSRAHLLELMAAYTTNDEMRLGRLSALLPAGSAFYNKRGSLVEWPTVVGDSAIFQLGPAEKRRAYAVSIHGVGKDAAGYEELEATLEQAVDAVGTFLAAD